MAGLVVAAGAAGRFAAAAVRTLSDEPRRDAPAGLAASLLAVALDQVGAIGRFC